MSDTNMITEADLNAYIDGELDPVKLAAVEAYLSEHPAESERVAAWRDQTATLQALYGHVADEAVPARLSPHRLAIDRRHRMMRSFTAIAAALVLVVLGGVSGWVGRGLATPNLSEATLVSEAEAAHALYTPEVLHPVEVSGEDGVHLTKWLSKRLDRSLTIPDLSSKGFSLVGGRLLPAASSAAALLMYENGDGARVTLYIVPKRGEESAMRFNAGDGLTAVSWQAETLGCVLVGNLPREALLTLAKESYASLDSGPSI